MQVVGYAQIKKDATTGVGQFIETYKGKSVRVMEFASDGGVICMNNEATSIAIFDKEDIISSFRCGVYCDVICPPGLNFIDQMAYHIKVTTRKGGYNPLLKSMVIVASLHRKEFTDSFLFSKK